jgi:hypothetical protein
VAWMIHHRRLGRREESRLFVRPSVLPASA